jgi:hypothetical protein
MTLVISKGITLRKGWQPMDPDAAAYITAVETADTEPLEEKTKIAIDNFVLGCKADGIWNAIKASCILAGARTLTGALVPLVGAAPTNVGGLFVGDDYNRKTGLIGNGSTKHLNSNRLNQTDPQDNQSLGVYISTAPGSGTSAYMGTAIPGTSGATHFGADHSISNGFFRSRINSTIFVSNAHTATGLMGMSRSSSSGFDVRAAGSTSFGTATSQPPAVGDVFVFGRNGSGAVNLPTSARFSYYWIGESLNLTLLDARVTDLINAFGAAIP